MFGRRQTSQAHKPRYGIVYLSRYLGTCLGPHQVPGPGLDNLTSASAHPFPQALEGPTAASASTRVCTQYYLGST